MTRNTAREIAMHFVYQLDTVTDGAEEMLAEQLTRENFNALAGECTLYANFPPEEREDYIRSVVSGVAEHREELDGYVTRFSEGWKLPRIPKTALAAMQIAMYEILYRDDIPTKVAINEALEIAKHYETAETVGFINGILGSFVKSLNIE